MKTLKQHIKDGGLEDFEEDLIGEEMKTFKQHVKEDHSVGTPEVNSVEDGNIGVHNIHDQKVLDRVNAFVGSIAAQEYLNPQAAVEQLANKLKTIGLEVKLPAMEGANGSVSGEVCQFGGRFGKDIDGSDINDDGISHKKEGGLKLNVKYETLENGSSKVLAKLA
jgi:hypothetical protein|tara:strand:- start:1014 stop:1508 length:495 start_codon:yes stop_codon:yes gene_type:complete